MTDKPPKYDPDWVSRYFDELGEGEWDRLIRSPVDEVNLHIHSELLKQYLKSGMEVLEIGAGAGRFTQVIADLGCRITVADLSGRQLQLNREKASDLGFASAITGWHRLDVCDMEVFQPDRFDAAVCYGGPISYVFDQAEVALSECRRVLTAEGRFLCSVMSLWGSVHRFLKGVLEVPPDFNRIIVETGDLTPDTEPGNKHRCHMFRSGEFRELLDRCGFQILEMSAANFLSIQREAELMEIRKDEVRWNELLRFEREACREPGCLDSGTHLIAACRLAEVGKLDRG